MVKGGRAVTNLEVLHGRLRPCFTRTKPFEQTGKYVSGLMSDLPRKNGWTLAKHAGDRTPDRMQRLLNAAAWDADGAHDGLRMMRGHVPRVFQAWYAYGRNIGCRVTDP